MEQLNNPVTDDFLAVMGEADAYANKWLSRQSGGCKGHEPLQKQV